MVQFRPLESMSGVTEILKTIGACHFSLIGRHHESVSPSEAVFELTLGPNEKKADLTLTLIVLTSQVATFAPGQRSKVRELKIEENPSLVKLVERF